MQTYYVHYLEGSQTLYFKNSFDDVSQMAV